MYIASSRTKLNLAQTNNPTPPASLLLISKPVLSFKDRKEYAFAKARVAYI